MKEQFSVRENAGENYASAYLVLCFRSEPKRQAFQMNRYKNFTKRIASKFLLE
jgi:hypothetical protein